MSMLHIQDKLDGFIFLTGFILKISACSMVDKYYVLHLIINFYNKIEICDWLIFWLKTCTLSKLYHELNLYYPSQIDPTVHWVGLAHHGLATAADSTMGVPSHHWQHHPHSSCMTSRLLQLMADLTRSQRYSTLAFVLIRHLG